jgi:two-component system, NtrC family, response regulator AtoC
VLQIAGRSAFIASATHEMGQATIRRVLVVDDEENLRLMLRTLLRKGGYDVEVAASGHEALARLEQGGIDFVLTDLRMPRMGGLELLREAQSRGTSATFVVMSAYGSLDLAVDAMKAGAYDYISKPFKPDEIILTLRKAEERESLTRENTKLRAELKRAARSDEMIARSRQAL